MSGRKSNNSGESSRSSMVSRMKTRCESQGYDLDAITDYKETFKTDSGAYLNRLVLLHNIGSFSEFAHDHADLITLVLGNVDNPYEFMHEEFRALARRKGAKLNHKSINWDEYRSGIDNDSVVTRLSSTRTKRTRSESSHASSSTGSRYSRRHGYSLVPSSTGSDSSCRPISTSFGHGSSSRRRVSSSSLGLGLVNSDSDSNVFKAAGPTTIRSVHDIPAEPPLDTIMINGRDFGNNIKRHYIYSLEALKKPKVEIATRTQDVLALINVVYIKEFISSSTPFLNNITRSIRDHVTNSSGYRNITATFPTTAKESVNAVLTDFTSYKDDVVADKAINEILAEVDVEDKIVYRTIVAARTLVSEVLLEKKEKMSEKHTCQFVHAIIKPIFKLNTTYCSACHDNGEPSTEGWRPDYLVKDNTISFVTGEVKPIQIIEKKKLERDVVKCGYYSANLMTSHNLNFCLSFFVHDDTIYFLEMRRLGLKYFSLQVIDYIAIPITIEQLPDITDAFDTMVKIATYFTQCTSLGPSLPPVHNIPTRVLDSLY